MPLCDAPLPGYDSVMNDVIDVRQLTMVYDAGVQVPALQGIDLRIERATFVAIMGPSGSGKSTLLNLLGALELPTSGQILIDGTDIAQLSENQRAALRRRRIGFVFQQFNLLPIFTALENVALPLRLDGVSPADADRRAEEMLAVVGLSERRSQLPIHLSGGENQRVAIARALSTSPALILADEPTGSLDSKAGDRVINLLRKLVDEQKQTVVMVTHDAAVAARADRVVSVRDGRIESDVDSRRGAGDRQRRGASPMISWRYTFSELRHRRGRSLLSLFSVVIAVSAVVAITSATATTREAFKQVFESLAGRANLEVIAKGGGGFPEDIAARLRELPGVRDVLPVLNHGTNIRAHDKKAKVLVVGIVPDDNESVADITVKEGRLPTGNDEIALESSLAESLGIHIGDEAELFTARAVCAS